jgi:outer membrane lipoprotein SlyB
MLGGARSERARLSGWCQWVALLGGIVGIAAAIIGSGNSNALVALVGVGGIVGSIGLAIWKTNENNVGIRMKHKDPIVVLSRVHPNAVQALLNAGIAIPA